MNEIKLNVPKRKSKFREESITRGREASTSSQLIIADLQQEHLKESKRAVCFANLQAYVICAGS